MSVFMPITPLFVPGIRADRFEQALQSGADSIIIDLEDSVSADQKDEARKNLLEFDDKSCNLFVRVNDLQSPFVSDDLECLEQCGNIGIMLSKSEDLIAITQWLGHQKTNRSILCLVETVAGLAAIGDLMQLPDVIGCAFGHFDFSTDLGCDADLSVLAPYRAELVLQSKLHGKAAPLDCVTSDISAIEQLKADCEDARKRGFGGKLLIHPSQVKPAQSIFMPRKQQYEEAKKLVDATANNAVIKHEGKMIDKPILKKAEQLMKRYEGLQEKNILNSNS
jgi:citrate lyase subunit beta / citryl-CoA lyase